MKLPRDIWELTHVLVWSLAGLVVLLTSYLVLQAGILSLPYIQVSTLHKPILLCAELFLIIMLARIYHRDTWGIEQRITYLLVFLAGNGFIAYPFLVYYMDRARQDIPLIRSIQPYLLPGYISLWAAVAILAMFVLQDVRRFRDRLVGEMIDQNQRDLQAALEREAKFEARFPKLASIPLIASLARAIYGEGQVYLLVLSVLGVAGLALRLWNLGALPPYADELLHLNAAKAILQGEALQDVAYRRSLYTVTLPVVISFKFFGIKLWAARLAGVLFNFIGAIPLYWLGRRIHKPLALLAVGLYLFSPWVIATSRTVREYAYYPFYFYLAAWLMLKLYERLPDHLAIGRDFKRLITPGNLIYAGLLILIVLYVVVIDPLSTFKVILGMYLAFGLLALGKIDWRDPKNLLIILLMAIMSGTLVISFLTLRNRPFVVENLSDYYLNLFYPDPPQQWYYNRPLISIVLLVLAILVASAVSKKRPELPFFLLTYGIAHLSFASLWVKGYKPRYAMTIEFWHILVMAAGLIAAQLIVRKLVRYPAVAWVGLLLVFWNFPQTLVPSLHTAPGYAPITGEHHANLSAAYAYLMIHARPGDGLIISTYFEDYIHWIDGLEFEHVYSFRYTHPEAEGILLDGIQNKPRGWIVIYTRGDDLWRQPVKPESFTQDSKQIQFVGWYGDQYILRWGD